MSVGKVQQRQTEVGHSDCYAENRSDALIGLADILSIGSFKDFSDIKSVSFVPCSILCALRNRHKYFWSLNGISLMVKHFISLMNLISVNQSEDLLWVA